MPRLTADLHRPRPIELAAIVLAMLVSVATLALAYRGLML